MASNAFTNCIVWNSISFWPYSNDYYDVYLQVKNKVEYYFDVHIVRNYWMGIWWFCRYSDRMVGYKRLSSQYLEYSRTYSFSTFDGKRAFGPRSCLFNFTKYHRENP